jgi:parvulin-like peptidyl-prolyl isomerase
MKRTAIAAALLSCLGGYLLFATSTAPAEAAQVPKAWLPSMDSTSYLPDTVVMVRVEDRVYTADDVRNEYYNLAGGDRPPTDSTGRAEFLNTLADKEVLALVARKANPPFEVEQRADLRRSTNTIIQNMLYQRLVTDSIVVTEDEIARTLPQFKEDVRVREILFEDRATAERVRRELLRGQIGWTQAYRRYSAAADSGTGEIGWVQRMTVAGDIALKLFSLSVGAISEVVQDQAGFHLLQVLERRSTPPLPMLQMRRMVIRDLTQSKTAPRLLRMYALARARVGAVYDTTNLRWAAEQFRKNMITNSVPLGGVVGISVRIPTFTSQDRERVLIRSRNRTFTLGQFLEGYVSIPSVMRRKITGLEPLISYVDPMFLEPVFLEIAKERGIDREPATVRRIEERREKLLVDRVFQDSVMSRVKDDPATARKYYEEHRQDFKRKLTVKYAGIIRSSKAGIDSVKHALDNGIKAETIVEADKAAKLTTSMIGTVDENSHSQYQNILLEELRPGSATMIGPDSEGKYIVLTVLERQEPRDLTFEEAETQVLDALRRETSDAELERLLQRHRREFRVETHPERVMAIRFTDPILE